MTAKSAFGTQAATSGQMMFLPPRGLVSWISMRNVTVIARLSPMPYAAPPRWVLVASGAPNRAITRHVMGMAILSARSTLRRFASPPDRSSARMNRVSSV